MPGQPSRILIVDDDPLLASMLQEFLQSHGYSVTVESRGEVAVRRIVSEAPDLVILDGNLPDKDGFEICREVRSRYAGRILLLTGRSQDIDQVIGLELGADDYVIKPVDLRVVLAHVHACLRRPATAQEAPMEVLNFGPLQINRGNRSARLNGKDVPLTTSEFELLWHLASHAGETVSRDQISRALRGLDHDGTDRSIDMRVSRLRRLLGDDAEHPTRIRTVRARGYLFSRYDWESPTG